MCCALVSSRARQSVRHLLLRAVSRRSDAACLQRFPRAAVRALTMEFIAGLFDVVYRDFKYLGLFLSVSPFPRLLKFSCQS